jgi:hypothetical protein
VDTEEKVVENSTAPNSLPVTNTENVVQEIPGKNEVEVPIVEEQPRVVPQDEIVTKTPVEVSVEEPKGFYLSFVPYW